MKKMKSKSEIGKSNRRSGAAFERRVRLDLEMKGWTVARWTNNIDLSKDKVTPTRPLVRVIKGRPIAIGTTQGFPDFIAYKKVYGFPEGDDTSLLCTDGFNDTLYEGYILLGIEVKINGYLDPIEREKCKWYLDRHKFSRILIASRGKEKKREIIYKEFEEK